MGKTIYPRCRKDMKGTYVNSEGTVLPCCWIGNHPHLKEYEKFHGADLKNLSVLTRPLGEVLASETFLKIEKTWNSDRPFEPCQTFCSKPFPPFKHGVEGTNECITFDLKNNQTANTSDLQSVARKP